MSIISVLRAFQNKEIVLNITPNNGVFQTLWLKKSQNPFVHNNMLLENAPVTRLARHFVQSLRMPGGAAKLHSGDSTYLGAIMCLQMDSGPCYGSMMTQQRHPMNQQTINLRHPLRIVLRGLTPHERVNFIREKFSDVNLDGQDDETLLNPKKLRDIVEAQRRPEQRTNNMALAGYNDTERYAAPVATTNISINLKDERLPFIELNRIINFMQVYFESLQFTQNFESGRGVLDIVLPADINSAGMTEMTQWGTVQDVLDDYDRHGKTVLNTVGIDDVFAVITMLEQNPMFGTGPVNSMNGALPGAMSPMGMSGAGFVSGMSPAANYYGGVSTATGFASFN